MVAADTAEARAVRDRAGAEEAGRGVTETWIHQVVDLPAGQVKLVLNERTSAGGSGSGDIAVAAIHFYICECMEGHFGPVSAGISGSGTPAAGDCGKVTGGGWIVGTPSGD